MLALVVGTALAWMNERTNTPFKTLFFALAIIPLVIPGILFTVSWIMLASPKIGLINLALQALFDTDTVFVNIYTHGRHDLGRRPALFADGVPADDGGVPLHGPRARGIRPLMSGASVLQVARRITLQLAWPAALGSLLILFVRSIESFEVPALLGLPVGIHVYTSSIYQAIHQYPSQIGLAAAYAVTLLLITSLGIYAQSRLSSQGARFSTVTGKGFRPRTIDLGRWRYLTGGDLHSLLRRRSCCCRSWCCCGRRCRNSTARRRGRRSAAREPRFLSRRARLSAVRQHRVEQPGAGDRQRHHHHAAVAR